MKTRVQRWGNSLAVRIPRAFAAQAGVQDGTTVEMTVVDGAPLFTVLHEAVPTLDVP
jgi:antitoxin MazE